jgi:hypothetical protein
MSVQASCETGNPAAFGFSGRFIFTDFIQRFRTPVADTMQPSSVCGNVTRQLGSQPFRGLDFGLRPENKVYAGHLRERQGESGPRDNEQVQVGQWRLKTGSLGAEYYDFGTLVCQCGPVQASPAGELLRNRTQVSVSG